MLCLKIIFLLTCTILISTKIHVVQGRYVFWPTIQRSIAQYKVLATWDSAKRHCDSQGAMLASPTDTGLLKHMQAIIGVNNHTTPYFIGIKARRDPELQFVSEEGILLEDISETAIYMIDKVDPRIGDCLCMDQHIIRAVPCWNRLPYMCYKNATDTPITTESAEWPTKGWTTTDIPITTTEPTEESPTEIIGYCDSGYKQYSNGRCYKMHDRIITSWTGANETCTIEGAYLAIINDSSEARIITNIVLSTNNPYADYPFIWIGLHDVTGNGDWRSVHGHLLESLYHVGELKNSRYDCGVIKYTGKLYDWHCKSGNSFVCEKSSIQ